MKNEIAELHELVAQIECLLATLKAKLGELAPAQPQIKPSSHARSLEARPRTDPLLGSL